MDFDKEAREIARAVVSIIDLSRQKGLADVSIVTALSETLAADMRRAFLAGQENMREKSADVIHSNVIALSRMAVIAKKSGLADEQDLMETQCVFAQELESSIRSLPLLEEPNKEVAG